MTDLEKQIVALMKGPDPPQSVAALLKALEGTARATVFSKISVLLSAGELTRDDLPWRRDQESRTKAGRPRKQTRKLAGKLQQWIDEGGKDRVQAAKALMELQSISHEQVGPAEPNDKEGTIKALKSQLAAVGREWATEAYNQLWPNTTDALDLIVQPHYTSSPIPDGMTLDRSHILPARVITVGAPSDGTQKPAEDMAGSATG
jgi:hypothetical protein